MIRALCRFLIRLYQIGISPFKAPCCRFTPTCSAYAREAFLLHGPIKGAMLTIRRISRCHPWGGFGPDPVPQPKTEKEKICWKKKKKNKEI